MVITYIVWSDCSCCDVIPCLFCKIFTGRLVVTVMSKREGVYCLNKECCVSLVAPL